jgi:hypothetical protein
MRKIISAFCLVVLITLASPVWSQAGTSSTADDQVAVEVTVYNSNLGLIKDVRGIQLPVGECELRFMDVASSIMPETVHARSLNNGNEFLVIEQNYEYDLICPEKLLEKYVGKNIKLLDFNEFQDKKEIVEATLLSNNEGQVYKINNEIYLGYPGYQILPDIPENLIAKPTLMWLCGNKTDKAHQLEVSYLTSNISWKADYVVVLDKVDSLADISGWVTISNMSGATYRNAGLKLVAGEVHRAPQPAMRYEADMKVMRAAEAPSFEEQAFFEYHIYDLQRKTTIKDNQNKQINFLEASGVKIEKELLTRGNVYQASQYGEKQKQPVDTFIKFVNSKENSLGMPLPEGTMRLYKKDDKDSLQFIGEDAIKHTPRDEKVELEVGEAFDIVVERTQTDYKRISDKTFESEWEITLRNHKEKDVTVGVIEPMTGSWKVLSKSHEYKELDAYTIRFDVKVPKDGEVKVTYRVRVSF